jgi:hypothetical protein
MSLREAVSGSARACGEINVHIVENVVPAKKLYLVAELDVSACPTFWEGQVEVVLWEVAFEFIYAFVSWRWKYEFLRIRVCIYDLKQSFPRGISGIPKKKDEESGYNEENDPLSTHGKEHGSALMGDLHPFVRTSWERFGLRLVIPS